MTVIEGEGIQVFRAMVIRSALDLYIRHGIKASRDYTPGNMLRAASEITGNKYRRGIAGLITAAHDLNDWIAQNHPKRIEEHKKEAR